MDDDEGFSDEARDDYLYAEHGRQYAKDHAREFSQDAVTSGLYGAILDAHSENYALAQAKLDKANARLGVGEWDEAVYHASRTLDGYTRAVFVDPFRKRMIQPFYEAFPHVDVKDGLLMKSVTGLRNASGFLYFGIAATADQADAVKLIDDLSKFLSGGTGGSWTVRNMAAHSLHDPVEGDARALVQRAGEFVQRLAAPLEAAVARNADARRKAEDDIKASMTWLTGRTPAEPGP